MGTTTSRSVSTAPGSGTHSTIRCSTPTPLPTTVSSLINQLFGKSREPFWQQAYTNLVRWIIELHRLLPGGWVTLRDVYRCTIDAELFARKIGQAGELAAPALPGAGRHRQQRSGHPPGVSRGLGMGAGPGWADGDLPAGSRAPGSARGTRRRVRDRGARGRGRERVSGAGRGDRAVVQPRLGGARCQAPHLHRRGHQRLPVAVRPAAGRQRVLPAASGIGRVPIYTYG